MGRFFTRGSVMSTYGGSSLHKGYIMSTYGGSSLHKGYVMSTYGGSSLHEGSSHHEGVCNEYLRCAVSS